jgi:hypothetical protein
MSKLSLNPHDLPDEDKSQPEGIDKSDNQDVNSVSASWPSGTAFTQKGSCGISWQMSAEEDTENS